MPRPGPCGTASWPATGSYHSPNGLSVSSQNHSGYDLNVYTNGQLNDNHSLSARGQLAWEPTAATPREVEDAKLAQGKEIMEHWKTQSLQNCSTCHR